MANNANQKILKEDIKNDNLFKFYVFHGAENYLKEFYVNKIIEKFSGSPFDDFNILKLEYPNFSSVTLNDFISSYPAMSDRKLLIISDMDLYKMKDEIKEIILDTLENMPEYLSIIIYYDILEYKADKRLKIHNVIDKNSLNVEFAHYSNPDLIAFIKKRAIEQDREINTDVCNYLIFNVGVSLNNLISEINKLCAYCSVEEISKRHIDEVCSKTVEAVIFEVTDAIADGKFEKALSMISDLILQKNEPVAIAATISKHISRLYSAKLAIDSMKSAESLLKMWGVRQTFYIKKMMDSARRLNLTFLRTSLDLCLECDVSLKTSGFDKQKTLEFLILKMASARRQI